MRENQLRWFGPIRCRSRDISIWGLELTNIGQVRKVKGRPKKTWMEVIRKDTNAKELDEDILHNRNKWKRMIHVLDLA